MTNYTKLQSRCQHGEGRIADANNLLAECYGALGKLMAENERLRKSLTYIRDTSDDWHVWEKAADALADAVQNKEKQP